MWRRRRSFAVLSLLLVLLVLVPTTSSLAGLRGTTGRDVSVAPESPGSALRALASPAPPGPYPIFNFLNAGSPVADPRTGYVYVADQGYGRTTIYDPARSAVVGYIDGVAGDMALDAASGELVVLQGDGLVFVDTSTSQTIASMAGLAPNGWRYPAVAIDPVDGLAFVAYNFQGGATYVLASTIHVVSLRRHAELATIGELSWTQGMTYDPLDGRVYAVNLNGGLTAIDAKTLTVTGAMSGLDGPNQIALDPQDGRLYVACWNGRYVVVNGSVQEISTASVTIVDPGSLSVVGRITGFGLGEFGPSYVTYSPADDSLYVANATAIIAVGPSGGTFRYVITGLSYPGPLAYDPVNGHVYAADGDGLVDINPATRTGTILGHEYSAPFGVAYDPVRNRIYAANRGGTTVVVIDPVTDRIVGSLGGFYTPDSVTYDPLADELFVGNELNYTLSIVDLKTDMTVATISRVDPWDAVYDNRSGNVFVGTDTGLLAISGRTNAIVANLTSMGGLWRMTVDPVHGRLYALTIINSPGTLVTIDTQNLTVLASTPLSGIRATCMGYDPVNGDLYVGTWGAGMVVIDPSTGRTVATIPGTSLPEGVLFDPANGYVYVTDQGSSGYLFVIDPKANVMLQSIPLPDQGNRMAYDPANQEIYVGVGMFFRGGVVVAVPSVTYPPPPILPSPWDAIVVGVGVLALVVALAVLVRRELRRARFARREPPRTEEPVEVAEPPRATEEPPPLSRWDKVAMGAVVLALVLAIAALFGPWFVIARTSGGTLATDVRGYGVSGWAATDTVSGATVPVTGNYIPSPSVASLFLAMEVVTLVAVLAFLAALVLGVLPRTSPRLARLSILLGFAAGGLAIAAPLAFVVWFPGSAQADGLLVPGAGFWGASWGPGWAWTGLLIAGLLFLVSSEFLRRRQRRLRRSRSLDRLEHLTPGPSTESGGRSAP